MARSIEAFKLKVDMMVDNARAAIALRQTEAQVSKLTGGFKGLLSTFSADAKNSIGKVESLGGALGTLATGPLGLAAGGFSAAAATVTGLGAAIFAVAKKASDFGSTIHDVSQQTGLGAETVSALKYAADESGSSIEE